MLEKVVLLSEALDDATQAYKWYEERSSGLGDRFLKSVDECIERIRANPDLHEIVYANYRRATMHRFPHVIFYRYDRDTLTIYSVFHTAQDPLKWKARLKQ